MAAASYGQIDRLIDFKFGSSAMGMARGTLQRFIDRAEGLGWGRGIFTGVGNFDEKSQFLDS